jgi:hypothetical protein
MIRARVLGRTVLERRDGMDLALAIVRDDSIPIHVGLESAHDKGERMPRIGIDVLWSVAPVPLSPSRKQIAQEERIGKDEHPLPPSPFTPEKQASDQRSEKAKSVEENGIERRSA